MGVGSYQPGVYVPLKALFLVFLVVLHKVSINSYVRNAFMEEII